MQGTVCESSKCHSKTSVCQVTNKTTQQFAQKKNIAANGNVIPEMFIQTTQQFAQKHVAANLNVTPEILYMSVCLSSTPGL